MIKVPPLVRPTHSYSILRRTAISFGLIFVLPSLILLYLWDKVIAESYGILFVSTVLCIALGFYFVWEMVRQTLALSQQAKELAGGKIPSAVALGQRPDELGELGIAIQNIAQNVEQKMQELQKTAEALEQTKKALSETTLYAESVIRSMADATIIFDPELKIKSVNRAAAELIGTSQSELQGRPLDALMDRSSPNNELLLKELRALGGTGTLCGKQAILASSSGERIPVDVNVSPLQHEGAVISGGVIIARDMRKILTLISELEQANVSLEEKVNARTSEMERAYRQLKEKDAQILHQEKMASVGLLAAGIAHEINNPIGYINSNLDVLGEYVSEIQAYSGGVEAALETLRNLPLPPPAAQEIEKTDQLKKELKIDDVRKDLNHLLQESKSGIDRVKRIVSDLRNFSHADENKLQEADLNAGIESTLNIVWNEIKYRAQVTKTYGKLPRILCYPQQLNQVFMNLLVNAAQAIEKKGEIGIKTYLSGEHVYIEISDTGAGISPENLKKIFDPFFTTKEVGKGTGLGLAIAYSIIEKHHGEIQVNSILGKGTTFSIKLPLDLKEEEDDEDPHSPDRGR